MCYNEKRTMAHIGTIQMTQLQVFITNFSKPTALGMLHFPKEHVAFKVLTENKVFYFLNRALHAGTLCNKRLK